MLTPATRRSSRSPPPWARTTGPPPRPARCPRRRHRHRPRSSAREENRRLTIPALARTCALDNPRSGRGGRGDRAGSRAIFTAERRSGGVRRARPPGGDIAPSWLPSRAWGASPLPRRPGSWRAGGQTRSRRQSPPSWRLKRQASRGGSGIPAAAQPKAAPQNAALDRSTGEQARPKRCAADWKGGGMHVRAERWAW